MQMRVYRSCSHPVAAMILVMCVDTNGIRYNWSWCKNLRSLSSKMVALICNVKESSIGVLSVRYSYDKITDVIGCNQQAYIDRLLVKYGMKMLMLASCRWIQAPILNRFPSLTCLMKSLCVLMQRWLASFSILLSTPCLSSANPWPVLLFTCPRRRRHISPTLRWCCVILLASRLDSSCGVANEYALFRNSIRTD